MEVVDAGRVVVELEGGSTDELGVVTTVDDGGTVVVTGADVVVTALGLLDVVAGGGAEVVEIIVELEDMLTEVVVLLEFETT